MKEWRASDRPHRRLPRGRRQAGRARRPPGALAPGPDPGRRARRDPRRRRARAPGNRPPARQGHQRADGRRPRRGVAARLCRGRSAAARSNGSISPWPTAGSPSRSGTIDAPIGRASRQRHRMAVSGAAPRQARTHFEVRRAAAPRDPARGAPGDRPHPSDPRPLRGDRPPAAGRPDLRRRAPLRARAPVPPRPPPRLLAPGDGREDDLHLRAARGPLAAPWRRPVGA